MKVLLIKDVYKVGRAGDVKKVANGFGRNYLIPQGLAVLATPAALKQAQYIRTEADTKRAVLNQEMSGIAGLLSNLTLTFSVKAGDTGKLYGSITSSMIAEAIKEKVGVEVSRRQMDFEPLRTLGVHKANVRLTIDLIPEITIIVHREGEPVEISELQVGNKPEEVLEDQESAEVEVAESDAEVAMETELEVELEEQVSTEVEVAESDAEVEVETEPLVIAEEEVVEPETEVED